METDSPDQLPKQLRGGPEAARCAGFLGQNTEVLIAKPEILSPEGAGFSTLDLMIDRMEGSESLDIVLGFLEITFYNIPPKTHSDHQGPYWN